MQKFINRKNYKKQLLSLIWIKIHSKPCKCRHWDSIFTANTNFKDHMSSPHQNNKEKCLQWDAIFAENIIWKITFLPHIRRMKLTNAHTACDAIFAENIIWLVIFLLHITIINLTIAHIVMWYLQKTLFENSCSFDKIGS